MFTFGPRSLANRKGILPKLLAVFDRAIQITTQDFMLYEGLRSVAQQRHNIATGVSQTMDSQHITQPDGFGHAGDLVPVFGGLPKWDWGGCYLVAMAVDAAATEQGVAHNIRWGGAWDKRLSDFGGDVKAYQQAVTDYQKRHPGPDFLDGPHFEWRM